MKSLLILFSLFFTLVLSGCKEGTIVYDIDFPRADSDEAQSKRIAPASVSLLAASPNLAENAGSVLVSATLNKTASSATTVLLSLRQRHAEHRLQHRQHDYRDPRWIPDRQHDPSQPR